MKNITQSILPACLLASTIFVFTSCTTVNTVERATPIGTKQMIADKRVITDDTLKRKVSIVGLNEGMTPGGFLQVQIEVLNQKNSMQNFSYRFEWFDMNGVLINTPTSYQTIQSDS